MSFRPISWTLAAVLCLTASAHATSVAEPQLAAISRVCVEARVPRYEPIPGRSPDELKQLLERKAAAILQRHGLVSDAQAPQKLVIDIRYAERVRSSRAAALLVMVEMREMAALTRERSDLSVFVTSWREARLESVDREEVDAVLSEALTLILDKFGEAVTMARASMSRGRCRHFGVSHFEASMVALAPGLWRGPGGAPWKENWY